MPAHATKDSTGYLISETDGDHVGTPICQVARMGNGSDATAQIAARILTIARNLPGGWERALELLKAERAKSE